IDEIQLIFNTQLEYDNFNKIMPDLVKQYAIEITSLDGSKQVIEVKDNYLRQRRHKIDNPNVKKIRIIFKGTYGSKYFQLFAIKLY
ncbi:MAG TPA: hypothetical protein DD426_07055, partial [Clostridiaceae bacterium]|nr:hypothetical protein [Clostridiaceae bacterium]